MCRHSLSKIICMHYTQAEFDELVASAHPKFSHGRAFVNERIGLNIFSKGATIKSSASDGIDDFLAHYTVQSQSIREFMSCLDEPETECCGVDSNAYRLVMPSSGQIPSIVCFSTPSKASSKEQGTTAAVQDSCRSKTLKAKPTTMCKRVKLTPEKREERRRDQNREAQRRFREKHMFQSHQNSFTYPNTDAWLKVPNFPLPH